MSKTHLTLLVLFCLTIASCKNDLEINAPWEEIPVVYGLLDANNSVQYIRIQKAYQNDVNTSTDQAAKIADSLYFDTLVVTIKGTDGSFYNLVKTNDLPKNPGVFSTEKNDLYRANFRPNENARYDLEIFSPKSGKRYKGSTSIISNTINGNLHITNSSDLYIRPSNIIRLTFTPTNANSYDALLRFTYIEYPTANPSDSVTKYIDYDLTLLSVSSSPNLRGDVRSRDWINFLRRNLVNNESIKREYSKTEYVVVGASLDLYNYYTITIPSPSIVQKRTDYSNIEGALGIFSSRSFATKNAILRDDSSRIYLLRDLPNFVN